MQTVDLLTPMVDDPYDYGAIAAAHALCGVYAVGAEALCATAIAAFPEDLDASIVAAIFRGSGDACARAGIPVIAGHTRKDAEPKFGLSVTGIVDRPCVAGEDHGEPGDVLILTKPIGSGILTMARRNDAIGDEDLVLAIESMCELNAQPSRVATAFGARTMAGVTGLGLIGHVQAMIGNRIGARIDAGLVPLFSKALDLAARDELPGAAQANIRSARLAGTQFEPGLPRGLAAVLCDAQTSGGLLIAIAPNKAPALLEALHAANVPYARRIGALFAGRGVCVEWNPPAQILR